jgi:hypothetical protein
MQSVCQWPELQRWEKGCLCVVLSKIPWLSSQREIMPEERFPQDSKRDPTGRWKTTCGRSRQSCAVEECWLTTNAWCESCGKITCWRCNRASSSSRPIRITRWRSVSTWPDCLACYVFAYPPSLGWARSRSPCPVGGKTPFRESPRER